MGDLFRPSRHVRRQTNVLASTPLTVGNQSHRLDSCRRRVSNPRGADKQDCRKNIPRALAAPFPVETCRIDHTTLSRVHMECTNHTHSSRRFVRSTWFHVDDVRNAREVGSTIVFGCRAPRLSSSPFFLVVVVVVAPFCLASCMYTGAGAWASLVCSAPKALIY